MKRRLSKTMQPVAIFNNPHQLGPEHFKYYEQSNRAGWCCEECSQQLQGRVWVYDVGTRDIGVCERCHEAIQGGYRYEILHLPFDGEDWGAQ